MLARPCVLIVLFTSALLPVSAIAQPDQSRTDQAQTDHNAVDQLDEPKLALMTNALNDDRGDSLTQLLSFTHYSFRDFTAYWENDGTLPNFIDDTDRYYTNGVGLELSFDPGLSPSAQTRWAISDEPADQQRFGVGITLKQRIFTPTSILQANPPARDHPYGGHLAVALAFQRADDHTHDHFGLELGITGHTSGAEAVQGWIHNTFPDEDDPLGWNTQLPTEATVNFAYTRTWKTERANLAGLEMEMLPALGFDLGTVSIAARSSMTLRIGKNLPTDFGPASLLGHKDHTVRVSETGIREGYEETNWSLYAYTRLGIDAIARDLFLDGTAFSASRSAQREPLVATFSFGVIVRYESFYLGWTQNIQTNGFEAQNDSQTWGSIVFGTSFEW